MSFTRQSSFIKTVVRRFRSPSSQVAECLDVPAADVPMEQAELASFLGGFTEMVEGMEERFVPLGEDLGNIVRHLQALAQTAGDGFGAIREEISNGSLGELDVRAQAALDGLRRQLAGVSMRMKPLDEVSDDMQRLRLLGHDVYRIGAYLQACGSSFAVESARTEASRIAFAAFVEELRDLAKRIADLSTRMDRDSYETLAQFTAARSRISENLDSLERLAHALRGAFATVSGEIQQLLGGMRSVLDRVERHRRVIAEQTGAVIYYLQFGDLVRQKCEHVLAAAREAQDAANYTASGNFPNIVRTSLAQLELIQREVDEARDHLSDGYASLNRELGLLAGCGSALSGGRVAGADDAWTRIKNHLRDLEGIQEKESKLNRDALDTASEAGAASAALQAGLGNVREMSSHLHLLALNAIIQTVHLGENGRALEELAQHVDNLHRTCDTLVPQVVQVLESIARRVADFALQEPESGALDLDGVTQLERAQEQSQTVMDKVLGLATTGEDMLRSAVFRLATLNSLSTEIEKHRASLARIAHRLPPPEHTASPVPGDFDTRMLQRYTMQSERDAHQRALGLAPAATAEPDIELFAPVLDAPATLQSSPKNDADLGDNIELF